MTAPNDKYAGILLPIFSLPSQYGIGDFGYEAEEFIDLLAKMKHSVWSILPLNPIGYGNSPYKTSCIFAGNYYFISPDRLVQKRLLKKVDLKAFKCKKSNQINYEKLFETRLFLLKKSFTKWLLKNGNLDKNFIVFQKKNKFWLEDYSLFMALKAHFDYVSWNKWDIALQNREKEALTYYSTLLKDEILFWQFLQFEFFEQWHHLHRYAQKRKVKIMGDLPFYVDFDSSDVWTHRNLFQLTKAQNDILLFSGVPGGDDFSQKDRRWGHPCYHWQQMHQEKYHWFLQRIEQAGKMFDILRIDHALGFIRYYGISDENQGGFGQWYDGPYTFGDLLIQSIIRTAEKQKLKIIVEDLGSGTTIANQLFEKLKWNSMRVINFAVTGKYGFDNTHLPCNYSYNTIAYSSTHDNPTLEGLLMEKTEEELLFITDYLKVTERKNIRKELIKSIYASQSEYTILSIQDILGLGNESRISFGADYFKSWKWQMKDFRRFKSLQNKLINLSLENGRS